MLLVVPTFNGIRKGREVATLAGRLIWRNRFVSAIERQKSRPITTDDSRQNSSSRLQVDVREIFQVTDVVQSRRAWSQLKIGLAKICQDRKRSGTRDSHRRNREALQQQSVASFNQRNPGRLNRRSSFIRIRLSVMSVVPMQTRRFDSRSGTNHFIQLIGIVAQSDTGSLHARVQVCLLYTSPSPRDQRGSRMPSSA